MFVRKRNYEGIAVPSPAKLYLRCLVGIVTTILHLYSTLNAIFLLLFLEMLKNKSAFLYPNFLFQPNGFAGIGTKELVLEGTLDRHLMRKFVKRNPLGFLLQVYGSYSSLAPIYIHVDTYLHK